MRTTDFAGRFGGEEFLLILPYTDEEGALVLVDRILQDLKEREIDHCENSPEGIVTFTAGISIKENSEDSITVVKKADEALYYGKKYRKKIVKFTELLQTSSN